MAHISFRDEERHGGEGESRVEIEAEPGVRRPWSGSTQGHLKQEKQGLNLP